MNYDELPEFSSEFKKLFKKYRSLGEDLEEFKKVIEVIPLGAGKHFNVLAETEEIKIIKARLFSRYLKGSSLRIIYSYCDDSRTIEFIEIYFKGDKENENRERIGEYLKKFNS